MRRDFYLFGSFVTQLVKKWVFWLFLALDIIAVLVEFFFPSLSIPRGIYLAILAIGFILAAFQVHLDLLSKLPSNNLPLIPEIKLLFTEGNEYSYQFENSVNKDALPHAMISLHATLQNTGAIPVKLLSVNGTIAVTEPYQFMVPAGRNRDGTVMKFPITVQPDDVMLFDVVASIWAFQLLTDAQVSAQTRNVKSERTSEPASAEIEYTDDTGKIYHVKTDTKVSLVPLCDLYIAHWINLGLKDLVDLATGDKVRS